MNEAEITDMHENGEVQEPESDPAGEDVGVVKLVSLNTPSSRWAVYVCNSHLG